MTSPLSIHITYLETRTLKTELGHFTRKKNFILSNVRPSERILTEKCLSSCDNWEGGTRDQWCYTKNKNTVRKKKEKRKKILATSYPLQTLVRQNLKPQSEGEEIEKWMKYRVFLAEVEASWIYQKPDRT
jgi:hypothetical protein